MGDVLVLDDDPALLEMIGDALDLEQIPHRVAGDGHTALDLIARVEPALILLDLNMPLMTGAQFCEELARRHPGHGIPIVLMTATQLTSSTMQDYQARAVLAKPFRLAELYATVSRYVERDRSRA